MSLNKFDNLVEVFAREFAQIKNFDILSEDPGTKKVFAMVMFRTAEVSAFKELVCSHFIPATNKIIQETKKDFNKSQYKHLIKENEFELIESLYEVIRLSYVTLFHKLESFTNELINFPEIVSPDLYNDNCVSEWALKKYKFSFTNWQQFPITHKINWICNCVKHKDGYPLKKPLPMEYDNIDTAHRIRLTAQEFKNDCDRLLSFYIVLIRTIFLFAQLKIILDDETNDSPELNDTKIKAEITLLNYIETIKTLK